MIISHNFISVLKKNCHKQILKQEILFEKLKFEIENLQNKLFNCYVHQQKFNQYALEVHFAFKHTNFQNDNPKKCDIYDNCIENNINFSQHIKNVHDIQM